MCSSVLPSRANVDPQAVRLVLARIREQFLGLEIRYERSGVLVTVLFRAQPEHAICESYPTGTAKNYQNSGDSKRPANVRMTIDEDSRNPEADPQRHSQGAIHSSHIQNHRHIASAVRRLMQRLRFYAESLIGEFSEASELIADGTEIDTTKRKRPGLDVPQDSCSNSPPPKTAPFQFRLRPKVRE